MAKKKAYDEGYYKYLVEVEGWEPNDAIREASTVMEGAVEGEPGRLDANQTYCDYLDYREDMKPSLGAAEGRRATTAALRKAGTSAAKWLREHPSGETKG